MSHVELKLRIPTETWKQIQREAEMHRVPPGVIAIHQLVESNKLPIRQRRMQDLRARIFDLWTYRRMTAPQIAEALKVSKSTVYKHQREIRDEWTLWTA